MEAAAVSRQGFGKGSGRVVRTTPYSVSPMMIIAPQNQRKIFQKRLFISPGRQQKLEGFRYFVYK